VSPSPLFLGSLSLFQAAVYLSLVGQSADSVAEVIDVLAGAAVYILSIAVLFQLSLHLFHQ
jgi:hypothetical protein